MSKPKIKPERLTQLVELYNDATRLWLNIGSLENGFATYGVNKELDRIFNSAIIRRMSPMSVQINVNTASARLEGREFNGCNVDRLELPIGDVWTSDDDGNLIIIDILETNEIRHMLFNKTLFNRAGELVSFSQWSYIVIIGKSEDIPIVRGALITLQEMGIVIVEYDDRYSLEDFIIYMIKRERGPVRADPRREYLIATDTEAVLMSFPGIGPSKAAVLLDHCGTLAFILDELTDQTISTPTFSKDFKLKIKSIFGLEEDQKLAVVPISGGDESELPKLYDQALERIQELQSHIAELKGY